MTDRQQTSEVRIKHRQLGKALQGLGDEVLVKSIACKRCGVRFVGTAQKICKACARKTMKGVRK